MSGYVIGSALIIVVGIVGAAIGCDRTLWHIRDELREANRLRRGGK